jgi:iron complex outermembrane recepter protein
MNKVPLRLTFIPAVFSRLAIAILILFTSTAAGIAAEQPVGAPHANTGSIAGRVMNQDTGNYVNNARVFIDALRLETFTDEFGNYIFPRVPVGEAVLRVVYTGLPVQTQTVSVTAHQRAEANISLHTSRATADAAILLDAFTVASKRDMAASDIAVNEQRFSAGIKNVVSTDSFADIADGNVGEFAKYLPGVTLNRNGSDGINMSLGGVPPSGTPILLDGMGIASASSSNPERTVEFENIAVGSMSRMEVTRSPSPDAPASAIGGSVNLVSRSAFERSRPSYTVKTYASWRGGDFDWGKTPGPFQHAEYPFEPNVELSAVVPVNRNFGFTFSGLHARTRNNGPGVTQEWVPTMVAASANFPATTADQPYLVRHRVQERPKITVRTTASLSADWRVTPQDVLTAGFQYSYFTSEFWVRQLHFDVGRAASFGSDFTQGAAGAGFMQIVTDARQKDGTSWGPSFRWRHNGRIWQWNLGGSYSAASNHYGTEDYFQGNNAFYRNLTVRFDQLTDDHPGGITVTDAAGRPADVYNLSNYRLETVSGPNFNSAAIVRSAYANAKRDLDLRVPLTLKAGFDLRVEHRDIRRLSYTYGFAGRDGIARSDDDNAAQWFDPNYSRQDLLVGPRMQWFDLDQIGGEFRSNPGSFTQTDAQARDAFRSGITTSQAITETIMAPYLRFDTKLLDGRLQVAGGVRYEHTNDKGDGPLIDPSLIYRRNAAGEIERDSAGRPIAIAPFTTLAGSQLAYRERASHVDKSYDGYFPSVNLSYLIRQNLIARVSYGRSINRPNFGDILPSMNLPDPESTARTITLTNPNLKPWTANSYGIALEYYFNEPSTGVLSARGYQRDITDFISPATLPATNDLLEAYGIDPLQYGEALGYIVSTDENVGDARVSAMEFDYRQNLTFLPRWARGFTVFANLTLQHLEGSEMATFRGFVGKTHNWGITYSRARFTVRLAVNRRGLVKDLPVTTAGSEPGTFIYFLPRNSADFSAEYRFTRHLAVYVSGRNVNEAVDTTARYGPSTPRDKIIVNRVHYGATWYVGLKGTF